MLRRLFPVSVMLLTIHLALAGVAFAFPASAGSPVGSVDEELARMGREVPGFGGLFYDQEGRPNVYLLDPEGKGASALKSLGTEVRVRRGDFEFQRLLDWKTELRPLLALPGVVFLDVDEARNRVVLGLDSSSHSKSLERDGLERRLLSTNVPRGAVTLVEASSFEPMVGVQNKFRPAMGGIQILFLLTPTSGGICTLGFNAYLGRVFGFVTNSHCTQVEGEVDGARFYQNFPPDVTIATEVADPGLFTDPPCPPGRRCRYSDSVFAKYDNPRSGVLGKIARPAFGDPEAGPLNLSPASARFTIKGRTGSPLTGNVVHKVGRTTGWTFGSVVATCVDANVGDSDITKLCQTVVRAGDDHGDSGSPVFSRIGNSTNVKLVGILWGGGTDSELRHVFVFSPLENIEQELGPLKVNN
jgi:hypothetical protein